MDLSGQRKENGKKMRMQTKSLKVDYDVKNEVETLVHRMSPTLASVKSPVVTFICARPGEGSSTVAKAFSLALHESGKKVLLISNDDDVKGFMDAMAEGRPVESAFCGTQEGFLMASWALTPEGRIQSAKLAQDQDFWGKLRASFDVIVIDSPSLRSANEGVAYAQASNATVLVVEAEATRKQVVEHLRSTLASVGVNIVGVVLNKRRFYIPQSVYDRL